MAVRVTDSRAVDGYEGTISELTTLITTCPPEFIFVHDPLTPRISARLLSTLLRDLSVHGSEHGINLTYAHVNAVACYTPRLLYDTVLNAFAGWTPEWGAGCSNWVGGSAGGEVEGGMGVGYRWNESFDAFVHGLQAAWTATEPVKEEKLVTAPEKGAKGKPNGRAKGKAKGRGKGEGKGKERVMDEPEEDVEMKEEPRDRRFVLVIERAERLKESMPELMVPLTRLAEISRLEITVIMHSNVRWELIRPPFGAGLDPYFVDVPPLSREAILARLLSTYPQPIDGDAEQAPPEASLLDPDAYHPNLRPLYSHFLTTLYGVCSLYTRDPDELAYIAAARWPGFVQPVLDTHRARLQENEADEGVDLADEDDESPTSELRPPDEHTRMRLTKLFTESTRTALEHLYPRHTHALAWAEANAPPQNLLAIPPRLVPSMPARLSVNDNEGGSTEKGLKALPRMAKFVLLAAFLASTNPAKTDMRMFGRGPDERKKKRRRATARKMSAKNAAVKIPQRLLGPTPFPLDRMLAILGVLLEENDADTRPAAPEYEIPGEYTEIEISRVAVYEQVKELASMHLLQRTSPVDRLDMTPVFKCGIGYDAALALARDVGVPLNDLMWDPA